jgi:hypothetical protein
VSEREKNKSGTSKPDIDDFAWETKRGKIREELKRVFVRDGIHVTELELDRIVTTPAIRDVFIVRLYNAGICDGEKAEWLCMHIGGMFDITAISVKKIVQDANNVPTFS